MSTRANVIIKDDYNKLYFYRHSDGYPLGIMPTLEKFLSYVKDGTIRDNASQAAGWLIIIGAEEYKGYHIKGVGSRMTDEEEAELKNKISTLPIDWKVGAYEPTTNIHGDIKHLYVIDLVKKRNKRNTKIWLEILGGEMKNLKKFKYFFIVNPLIIETTINEFMEKHQNCNIDQIINGNDWIGIFYHKKINIKKV